VMAELIFQAIKNFTLPQKVARGNESLLAIEHPDDPCAASTT
jgi:hypothetical protein